MPRDLIERLKVGHDRIRRRRGNLQAAPPFRFAAPWQHQFASARSERSRKLDPVRHRPFLLAPRRRVQQHDLARWPLSHQRRAIEPEIDRAIRRIAKRLSGEHAVARDRVQRSIDAMVLVIEP